MPCAQRKYLLVPRSRTVLMPKAAEQLLGVAVGDAGDRGDGGVGDLLGALAFPFLHELLFQTKHVVAPSRRDSTRDRRDGAGDPAKGYPGTLACHTSGAAAMIG